MLLKLFFLCTLTFGYTLSAYEEDAFIAVHKELPETFLQMICGGDGRYGIPNLNCNPEDFLSAIWQRLQHFTSKAWRKLSRATLRIRQWQRAVTQRMLFWQHDSYLPFNPRHRLNMDKLSDVNRTLLASSTRRLDGHDAILVYPVSSPRSDSTLQTLLSFNASRPGLILFFEGPLQLQVRQHIPAPYHHMEALHRHQMQAIVQSSILFQNL